MASTMKTPPSSGASQQLSTQIRLMMWRNFVIKKRKSSEVVKGWILPILVFAMLWLVYQEFPDILGTVREANEKFRNFDDDELYAGVGEDADDLFAGGDDDVLFAKVQRDVVDVALNSYLEQIGVPVAFLQLQWSLITLVVMERETRVLEMMLMMGLKDAAYWLSMFFTEVLTSIVLCLGLSLASVQWGLFHGAPFLHVAALLLCYATATVPFLYFGSCFFRSAQSAAQATALTLLSSIAVFVATNMRYISPEWQTIASLLPPFALQYGIASFFPTAQELGLPVCVDTCPSGYVPCSHVLGFNHAVCGENTKRRFRDFCDWDSDCCGDSNCRPGPDGAYFHAHGGPDSGGASGACVINMHSINCVTQHEFDATPLHLSSVLGLLLFDTLLFATLAALAVHRSWSLESAWDALLGWLSVLDFWRDRKRKNVRGNSDDLSDDIDDDDNGASQELLERPRVASSDVSEDDEESSGAGTGDVSKYHPPGYVEETSAYAPSVKVAGLQKTFMTRKGEKHQALDKTCLSLVEGECTVLMGQNGAGKTSLINCLTGRMAPDGGSAMVYGHDVRHDQRQLRQSLGVCPQEDALFEGFTPTEMLSFYAALKGVPPNEQAIAVQDMLYQMGLATSAHGEEEQSTPKKGILSISMKKEAASMFVEELSGGQRRRVSIGIALIGDSKLVILDEPTSAMDPVGKLRTWALLRQYRVNRTILLTTHLMDEADAVADRVAVMCAGRVYCTGSPAFLKRKLGLGYTLTLASTHSNDRNNNQDSAHGHADSKLTKSFHENSRSNALTAAIAWAQARLGQYKVSQRSSNEVYLTLPFTVNAASFFQELEAFLADWQQRSTAATREALRVESGPDGGAGGEATTAMSQSALVEQCGVVYGLEMPSLESVFLRVTSRALGVPNPEDDNTIDCHDRNEASRPSPSRQHQWSPEAEEPWLVLLWQQSLALCRFRLHVALVGETFATINRSLPQALAFVVGSIVLSAMHSLNDRARGMLIAGMALSTLFVPGSMAATLLFERQKGLRHLLAVSGCSETAFWFGTWLAECSLTLGPTVALWLVALVRGVDGWSDNPWFYAASLVFMVHSVTFASALSFCFPSASSANLFAPGVVLVGTLIAPCLSVLGLHWLLPSNATAALPLSLTASLIAALCFCSPHLLFATALTAMHVPSLNAGDAPSAILCVGLQLFLSVVFASIAIYMEGHYSSPQTPTGRLALVDGNGCEDPQAMAMEKAAEEAALGDDDVRMERLRARQGGQEDVMLQLVNLRKEYASNSSSSSSSGEATTASASSSSPSKVSVVVRGMSVVAKKGECLGLLGPNGAGKSTTIGMLTRLVQPSEGDALLSHYSVLREAPKAFQHLGLVPQDVDTLWAHATVSAHLTLFASLRGKSHESTTAANHESIRMEREGGQPSVLHAVGLSSERDREKRAGDLSVGMRRRLSTAIALVGKPSVVVLDEPTAGLDPLSRRLVWDSLRKCVARDHLCMLLTTHSLDEAEALCHRLGIVVDGALRCIGTPLHLKRKYGGGYEVSFRAAIDANNVDYNSTSLWVSSCLQQFKAAFPGLQVLELVDNRFKVRVPKEAMHLPRCFALLDHMCNAKEERPAEERPGGGKGDNCDEPRAFYCVSLSSIEQVFLDVVENVK